MSAPEKRFIIRKYISASSAMEAIEKESTCPVHEVYLDEKQDMRTVADAIGFRLDCQRNEIPYEAKKRR